MKKGINAEYDLIKQKLFELKFEMMKYSRNPVEYNRLKSEASVLNKLLANLEIKELEIEKRNSK